MLRRNPQHRHAMRSHNRRVFRPKVSNLSATTAELRRRSLRVVNAKQSVSVIDPDGNIVVFKAGEVARDSSKTPRGKK
jgi:hypothetical protein